MLTITGDAGRLILSVVGEWDYTTSVFLASQMDIVLPAWHGPVTVDLTRCRYLDNTGIHALVREYKAFTARLTHGKGLSRDDDRFSVRTLAGSQPAHRLSRMLMHTLWHETVVDTAPL